MNALGRGLIIAGIVLALAGVLALALDRVGVPRLPGDILVRRGRFTFYAPLGLMLLVSLLLTLALNLFARADR